MNIISNSSPLIFLSKLRKLDLLGELFEKIYIPTAVYEEILSSNTHIDDIGIIVNNLIESKKLIVFSVKNEIAIKSLLGRLHKGEVEVIIGANELNVNNVILDDLYARNKAKQFGLSVTGTLGILILAFRNGLINDIESELKKLIEIGFRISDGLIAEILVKCRK